MRKISISLFSTLAILLGCTPSTKNFASSGTPDSPFQEGDTQEDIRAQKIGFKEDFTIQLVEGWALVKDSTNTRPNVYFFNNTNQEASFLIQIIQKSPGEASRLTEILQMNRKVTESNFQTIQLNNQNLKLQSKLNGFESRISGENLQGEMLTSYAWIAEGKNYYYKILFEGDQTHWETIVSSFTYDGNLIDKSVSKSKLKTATVTIPEIAFSLELDPQKWLSLSQSPTLINQPLKLYTTEDDSLAMTIYGTAISNNKMKPEEIIQAYLLNHGIEFQQSTVNLNYIKRTKDNEEIEVHYESTDNSTALAGVFQRKNSKIIFISQFGARTLVSMREVKAVFNSINSLPNEPVNFESHLAELYNQIGIIKLASNQPLVALSYFEDANKLNPQKALFLLNSGFIYQLKNLEAPGLKVFESQSELVNKHGKLLWIQGEMYEKRGYYDLALGSYLKARSFYPDHEELIINLSDAYWGAGYKIMSLRVVEDLYSQRPSARLGTYLAKTLLGLERHNDGVSLLYELKKNHGLRKDLGHALLKGLLYLERYEEALAIQAQFAAKHGPDEHSWYAKGKSEFYLKQFKQAEISLRKSLNLESSNDEASSLLAATKSFLGKGNSKDLSKKIAPTFKLSNIQEKINKNWEPHAEAGALVHWAKESLKFKKGDSWSITTEVIIEILDSAGLARFQEFNESFIPGYDRIYINKLQVFDSSLKKKWGGSPKYYYVTSEMGSEISKQSQLAHLPVKSLNIGDFIQLQLTRVAIRPAQYIPYLNHIANRDLPVYQDIFEIQSPPKELDFEEFGDVSDKEAGQNMVWIFNEPKTIKIEPLMPNVREIASGVMISESRTWSSVGKEYEDLIKHQFSSSIPVKEKALELKGNFHDAQFILDTTVAWVRKHIRYRDIKLGGSSLIPAKSSQTLANYQGDCKDQSLLLKELLNEYGIKSHLLLINLIDPVSPATATIQQFNHMILYVPPGQGVAEQYIDLTEPVGSHRIIPYALEGKNALVIEGEKSKLITTPILENSREHYAEFNHKYFLNTDGSLEVKETILLDGKFGALFRERLYGFTEDQMREYLRRWFSTEVPNIQVQTIKLTNLEKYQEKFKIELILRSEGYWKPSSNEPINLPNIWERTMMRLPQTNQREHPIKIPDELIFLSKSSMTAPSGYTISYPKSKKTLPSKTHYTEFNSSYEEEESQFKYQTNWTTYAAYAAPSEYLDIRKEWNTILNETLIQIQVTNND